jgi:hypothetical protein
LLLERIRKVPVEYSDLHHGRILPF